MKSLVGAGTLLVALVVSGCAGDPEPQFAPEPSPSPSAPATSAEPEPEAWEEKTPEGAVAYVEHWLDTFNEAVATGDTGPLSSLANDDCSSCVSLARLIDEVYEEGGSIDGEPWDLRKINYSSPDGGRTVGVGGVMAIPKQTIKRPGQAPETSEALSAQYFFTLAWGSGSWSIDAIETQT